MRLLSIPYSEKFSRPKIFANRREFAFCEKIFREYLPLNAEVKPVARESRQHVRGKINFEDKIFAFDGKSAKFAKILGLENFSLYGNTRHLG